MTHLMKPHSQADWCLCLSSFDTKCCCSVHVQMQACSYCTAKQSFSSKVWWRLDYESLGTCTN